MYGMSGFTYNGVHCEELGCTYIPDASGNWFQSPDIDIGKDDVNWRDGNYYYYTRRKARTFTLNCYFEEITMTGRERIRRWLDENGSGWLIFDDREYVKYKVHPSKVVTGKIYRQHTDYDLEDRYNGTLTVTFEAEEPLGYLTKLTDEDLLDTQQDNICNLIRSDMMPAAPAATDSTMLIYNQGTQPCFATIRLAGSAPNGLTIYNNANGTMCKVRGLPESGTLVIDSKHGLVTTESQYGTEITFAYHDHGYIVLEPNNELNYTAHIEYTNGSTSATILTEISEDLTGYYIWIDNAWNKIMNIDSAGNATLMNAAQSSGAGTVHLCKMNEIDISGEDMSLTTLG